MERLSARTAHTATRPFWRHTLAVGVSHPFFVDHRMNFFFNMRGTMARHIAEERAVPGMF